MKKIIYYMTALVLASGTLTSCNDYLDTVQNKGNDEVLTSGKQIEALFANSEMFNTKAIYNVFASDDYGLTTDHYDALGYVDENIINGMSWNINDVISNLAQAHMLRAMAMWSLVNTYCLPYSAGNASSLGLPLKQTTSYEEAMPRATLQQTYDFILADLDAAANTANTGIAANKRWWVSRPAVEAMKARIYLFMQEYDKAATHAVEALKCGDAQLDDYNQLHYRVAQVSLDGEMQDVYYSELYRYGDNQVANYKENYLSEYFTGEFALIPSEELISLYDQDNDLRFKHFRSNGQIEQNTYDEGSVQITQLEMPDDEEGGGDGGDEGDDDYEDWDD